MNTAVERLYGSWDALNAALDALPGEPADIWSAAWEGADRDATGDAVRDLWSQDEHPGFPSAEAEAAAVELARSPHWSPAREAAREALTAAYMPAIKAIIKRHAGDADWHEDVQQTALLGFWEGVAQFDPARHRRLAALVQRRVLAALSDAHAARFGMTVPEAHRLAYAKIRAEAAKVAQNDPRSLDDIAAALAPSFGLSALDYWHVDRVVHLLSVDGSGVVRGRLDHDDCAHSFDVDDPATYMANPSPLVEPSEPSAAAVALAASLLDRLTDREREVVARYFGLDGYAAHTDAEVGAALGVTKMRANQIRNAALAKMRESTPAS